MRASEADAREGLGHRANSAQAGGGPDRRKGRPLGLIRIEFHPSQKCVNFRLAGKKLCQHSVRAVALRRRKQSLLVGRRADSAGKHGEELHRRVK